MVSGLPGGGKTIHTMDRLDKLKRKYKIIYAAPLRKLRDYIASRFDGYVIRSKSELCTDVAHIEEEASSTLHYLIKVYELCSKCTKTCEFKEQMKDLFKGVGLYCMTSKMLYQMSLISPKAFKDMIVVIDEAESWLDLFEFVCTGRELMSLLSNIKDRSMKRRIMRSVKRLGYTDMYYLTPAMPMPRLLILISATFPESLYSLLPIAGYSFHRAIVESSFNDVVYTITKPAYWINDVGNGVERSVWIKKLIDLTISKYDEGKSVGIASRNYELTKMLTSRFMEVGIRLYSDYISERPPKYESDGKFVIIWTTRGRWYRGISLPDTDVIICTYQSPQDVSNINTFILAENEMSYVDIMNKCINTQSYFRSNRNRVKSHEIHVLDYRGWISMKESLSHYSNTNWFNRIRKPMVIDL